MACVADTLFALLLLAPVFFAHYRCSGIRAPDDYVAGGASAPRWRRAAVGRPHHSQYRQQSGVPLQITLLGEAGPKVLWAVAFRLDHRLLCGLWAARRGDASDALACLARKVLHLWRR